MHSIEKQQDLTRRQTIIIPKNDWSQLTAEWHWHMTHSHVWRSQRYRRVIKPSDHFINHWWLTIIDTYRPSTVKKLKEPAEVISGKNFSIKWENQTLLIPNIDHLYQPHLNPLCHINPLRSRYAGAIAFRFQRFRIISQFFSYGKFDHFVLRTLRNDEDEAD